MKNKLVILIFIIIFLVGTLSYSLGLFSVGGTQVSSLEKGLVAHYPLNGEYGTKDITPNANHGTNNGATLTTGRKGEANGAYDFMDGSVTYIDCASSPETNFGIDDNFTISYWIYLPRIVSTTTVKHGSINVAGYYDRIESNGLVRFMINSAGGTVHTKTAAGEIIANQWYFITMKKEGHYAYIYINGVEKVVDRPYITNMDFTTENLILGMYASTDSASIAKTSDVRIYNRALEEDEIKLLYDSFKPEIATSDLNKGLVGHWMLDSENGAKDLTPNGNHGTANGGITIGGTTDRKGRTGGATEFDGVDDSVDCGNDESLDIPTLSISAWVKFNYNDEMRIIKSSDTFDNKWVLTVDSNGVFIISSSPTGINQETISGYNDGLWHHIVAIKIANDYENYKIYVDGQQVNTRIRNEAYSIQGNITIGARDGGYYWKGSISDVRIYNRALSSEEISLLYSQYKPKGSANVGSLNKGLVLDMPLTTKHMKSATVVSDRTPYGNDGTVSGATVGSDSTSFDGSDDYIEIPHNSNQLLTTGGSISVWINPKSLGESNIGRIIDKSSGTSANNGFFIIMSSLNKLYFRIGSSSIYNVLAQENSIPFNYWTHVLVTWNSTGYVRIYVNGILNAEGQGENPALITTTNAIRIGNRATATDRTFKGQISNIKIYNRALSAEEVKLLYEKGRS